MPFRYQGVGVSCLIKNGRHAFFLAVGKRDSVFRDPLNWCIDLGDVYEVRETSTVKSRYANFGQSLRFSVLLLGGVGDNGF